MDGRHGTVGLQVIVAHQQTLLRQVMVRLLEDESAFEAVLEAATSDHVRAAVSASRRAAVLLDDGLAGGDTARLVGEITAATPDIVVILLTDDVTEESVASVRAAGVAAIALKTMSLAALTDTIRRACASNRVAQQRRSA